VGSHYQNLISEVNYGKYISNCYILLSYDYRWYLCIVYWCTYF